MECQEQNISKEDLTNKNDCSVKLRRKLAVSDTISPPTEHSLQLLLKATYRLVGKASLLHTGYREVSDPYRQGSSMMRNNIKKYEKQFILLDEQQRNLLMNV